MMEMKEKLALSARPGKLTLIREGMFLKCYQQSLFSLVHSVYPDIKVTGRRIKKLGGQVVFSGGFPEAVLAKGFCRIKKLSGNMLFFLMLSDHVPDPKIL
ncbi:hypothetical protein ACI2JI_24975 [Enterobacter cancerogenus]|uniref:hypothetical protein n=1 Tax=Enterobacter cancerogenus TaxID=69218 RepID=UPI00384E4C93